MPTSPCGNHPPGRTRAFLLAGVALALAGCAPSLSCTAMGCYSGVMVDLSRAGTSLAPGPATATLCVGGDCRTSDIRHGDPAYSDQVQNFATDNASASGPVTAVPVTLTIKQAGRPDVTASTTTDLTRTAPNGDQCGPVCWYAALSLIDGRLVPYTPADPVPPKTPRLIASPMEKPRLLTSAPGDGSGMAAEVTGTVGVGSDGCVRLDGRPTVWPAGTTWDADAGAVRLPDGTLVPVGGRVTGAGGYLAPSMARTWVTPEADAIACEWDVEAAVFNPGAPVRITTAAP